MHYQSSYDAAKFRHFQFLLDELIKLSNMVPDRISTFVRPPDFPLPTLFVLLGLKFDSGLGYRTFVSLLKSNPLLLETLGLERAPSYSILQQALNAWTPDSSTRCPNSLLERDLLQRTLLWTPLGSLTPLVVSGCPCGSKRRGNGVSQHFTKLWTLTP